MATVTEGVDTEAFALELRSNSGALSEAKEVRMDYTIRDPGKPIRLVLASRQVEDLEAVAGDVREALLSYPGVFDVSDSFDSPRDELVSGAKAGGRNAGHWFGGRRAPGQAGLLRRRGAADPAWARGCQGDGALPRSRAIGDCQSE